LAIIEIGRARLEFPMLVSAIQNLHDRYQTYDGKLRGIIIEDKSSGIGAIQTLKLSGNIAKILKGFNPRVDKPTRWSQAAVWCSLDCILLPWPGVQYPWLIDAEEELFSVPGAPQLDQADSFSQLILFLENLLADGHKARSHQ
jgi:phage terminase large subunit-like protein